MQSSRALFLAIPLLASCAAPPTGPMSLPLQERLRNPIVAERYWSGMAEHMADFTRTQDPVMKDPIKAAIVESERTRALERVAQARILKKGGLQGVFLAVGANEDAFGDVLLREGILFFSSTFEIKPSPSVQVYLTSNVDPRDGRFPDDTSVNLGILQTAFGPQEYAIPDDRKDEDFRSVVLYDTRLERLIGFAQLATE